MTDMEKEIHEISELCEKRGLPYKGKFLMGLHQEKFEKGTIKFNIPDSVNLDSTNGEGVWGWVDEEGYDKYRRDDYHGQLTVILCNAPLTYSGILFWGSEVVVDCHGENRPTLSPEWVKRNIIGSDWFKAEQGEDAQ